MKHLLLGIFVTLFAGTIFIFNMKKNNPQDDNVIIVGTNAEYQPFTWIENNTIVGLDIDIIKTVAERIGKQIKFIDMSFSMLIPEAQLGKIHVIAAGLTPTTERAEQLLFTDAYLKHDPLLIISLTENKILTIDELKNKTVVVNEGYTADLWASQQSISNLVRMDNPSTAFLLLNNKRADAFITAELPVQEYFKVHGKQHYACSKIEGVGDEYAFAVSKKHPTLYADINAELSKMHQDGTLQKIIEKWMHHD